MLDMLRERIRNLQTLARERHGSEASEIVSIIVYERTPEEMLQLLMLTEPQQIVDTAAAMVRRNANRYEVFSTASVALAACFCLGVTALTAQYANAGFLGQGLVIAAVLCTKGIVAFCSIAFFLEEDLTEYQEIPRA